MMRSLDWLQISLSHAQRSSMARNLLSNSLRRVFFWRSLSGNTYTERGQYPNETHLKSFNDLKLAVDTTFTPSSGALGNVVKADYNANGITAGVKFRIQKSRLASLVKAS